MLVPRPRKMKERRKNAASTMDTNLTQKLSLLRFIIMAVYPPGSSGAKTIVYHVTTNDRGRDSRAGGSFENAPFEIPVLLGGSRRQVRGYGLGGEQLHALCVADGRDTNATPLVSTEDVCEPARTTLQELDLLGALGEVDRELPPHLPRLARNQTRGLRINGVRGMHTDLRVDSLRQTFSKLAHLRDYKVDSLLRGTDLMREELGVDGPRHPAFGELRQAFSVRG